MKQEITSTISTLKNKIHEIAKFLYDNPEDCFNETNAVTYISNILTKNNFKVTPNYMNIETSFQAQCGEGHPKICFICEYDGDPKAGHIYGNNLSSSISIAAAISLSKVLKEKNGSVILIGTPGELSNNSKTLLNKQGAFDDMDVLLISKPHVFNLENPKSLAKLSLKVKFIAEETSSYSAVDAYCIILSLITQLSKGFASNSKVEAFSFSNSECLISITSDSILDAEEIRKKIEIIANTLDNLLTVTHEVTLAELPYEEIKTSAILNRLFAHNLKECGIINLQCDTYSPCFSSLGCISKTIPCINSYISIVEDPLIQYPSKEFAKLTLSDYAQEIACKAAQALAFTGLDLIQKQNLITEIKTQLHASI